MTLHRAFLVLVAASLVGCGVDFGQHESVASYQAQCASCHGPDGLGNDCGPQIRHPVTAYATYVVRSGRPSQMGYQGSMPRFSTSRISDAELASILAELSAEPLPATGEGLYVTLCGNCHGDAGRNGRVDEDIAGEDGDDVLDEARDGHGDDDFGDRGEYMPAWTAQEVSDAQLQLIAAYLGSSDPGHHDDDDDDDGDSDEGTDED